MLDRPVRETDEIEVTPEMIEAGVLEFYSFDNRFDIAEEAVEKILRAMLKARH